ncbi:hypothetical protein RJ640_029572 [Escallonia rubra]|uniref:Uncharacterized protein n=1 Tax=Escallonia rubra TaxID=112253 RepID=A0AA88RPX0_9ASTE|nr:hypothetical protein RJ640_029572 [Escallonia rubra]
MSTKNVIADLVKGEKLNGDNYDVWHKKMKFMLNGQELEEHLTKEMVAPTEAQPLRDHTAYQKWNQKDRSAHYTLLSSLQNDLIWQYDELLTCKALWDQLKFSFGGTSTTRLRSLVMKFEEYTKDPKHTMSEHLRVMSNMIGKLRDAGHALTDEQQVRAVIRSLPASWANMKHILTHSENIKNFSDISQHVILEAETRDADKALTYVAQVGTRNANGNIGDASKNLDLYDLEEVETTLPSPSEAGNDMNSIVATKQWLSPTFEMKDMGETNYVLRVKIVHDHPKRLLGLSQETYIKKVIERFSHADEAVAVHCDNTIALDFVKDLKYHGKAKLIGLRYHFIRTLVAQGEVAMKHIPTGRMVVDPLTKHIARDVFLSHIRTECEISDRHYESDWAEKLRLCHEEDTQCRYFSMYLWIMDDAVSRGMSRKAVGSNWNDMRALGRKFNITSCCVIHSPGDFVDFRFDMSHEYITYERFNTAHYEGFESV